MPRAPSPSWTVARSLMSLAGATQLACAPEAARAPTGLTGVLTSAAPTSTAFPDSDSDSDSDVAGASTADLSSTSDASSSDVDVTQTAGDDTSGSGTTGALAGDDAKIVASTLPDALGCGEPGQYAVTMRNIGANTWSRDGGYKLGTVDDEDPLHEGERVYLPEGVYVAPGQTHTFEFELVAPDEPGTYLTDWQMVHEGVQWFGEQVARDVAVSCAPVDPPPLELGDVIWLHTDVSAWPVTMTLASVTFEGGNICLNHGGQDEGVYVWPQKTMDDETWVVGNPWVFIYREGDWYGATWEWLRPDQICKAATSVAGDHIKQAPFDANSGWTPTPGETLYFMVSGLARLPGFDNVQERSAPLKVVWP